MTTLTLLLLPLEGWLSGINTMGQDAKTTLGVVGIAVVLFVLVRHLLQAGFGFGAWIVGALVASLGYWLVAKDGLATLADVWATTFKGFGK